MNSNNTLIVKCCMKLFKFFLPCLIILFFSNCNPTKKNTSTANNITGSNTPGASLTETYWKLTVLNGKPVAMTPADTKEIHITLRKEGNRVEGFGGCNGFGGTYDKKNDFNISFSSMIGTMMACPKLETENELYNALKLSIIIMLPAIRCFLAKGRWQQ